jgi:hypothetical protein
MIYTLYFNCLHFQVEGNDKLCERGFSQTIFRLKSSFEVPFIHALKGVAINALVDECMMFLFNTNSIFIPKLILQKIPPDFSLLYYSPKNGILLCCRCEVYIP